MIVRNGERTYLRLTTGEAVPLKQAWKLPDFGSGGARPSRGSQM